MLDTTAHLGQQPPAPRACGVRVAPARRRTRTRAAPELQARARHRRQLRRRRRGGRHRRHGRPAHRRRLADHAARAMGVPGPHRDRRVPTRPRGPARRAAAAGANACERPARLRVLPPQSPTPTSREPHALFVLTLEGDRISAITWFADTQRLPAVRTAADAAVRRLTPRAGRASQPRRLRLRAPRRPRRTASGRSRHEPGRPASCTRPGAARTVLAAAWRAARR